MSTAGTFTDEVTTKSWRPRGRIPMAATVALVGSLWWGVASVPASSLPRCPSTATWPSVTVSTPVKTALTKYYAARHLTPITIYRNRMWVMNVVLERVGTHWCSNPDGGRSGYVGVVPKNATAAVLVRSTHRPYPVTRAATTFATVVKLPTGWRVVSDDTGP